MKNERLQLIQFSRGLAAIIVVLYHTSTLYAINLNHAVYNNAFKFGKSGVDFFFVLSGFIIYIIHEKDFGKKEKISQYIIKRFIRIFPLYWIVLSYKIITTNENVGTYIASILLLPIVSPPLVSVSWTLSYEILFYIIFGILILNNNKTIQSIIYIYLTIILVYWIYNSIYEVNYSPKLKFLYSYYYIEFFFGICAGYIYRKNIFTKGRYFMTIFGMALFIVFSYLSVKSVNYIAATENLDNITRSESLKSYYENNSYIFFGIPSFFIISGISLIDKINKLKLNKYLLIIGDSSFSIYLIHSSLINIITKLINSNKLNIEYSIIPTILFCIITGIVFHKLVEAPLLNKINKIVKDNFLNEKYIKVVN